MGGLKGQVHQNIQVLIKGVYRCVQVTHTRSRYRSADREMRDVGRRLAVNP